MCIRDSKLNGRENKQASRRDLIDGLWTASEKFVGVGV